MTTTSTTTSYYTMFQQELMNLLSKNGAMTRDQIVQKLDRARTTVYDNLTVLQDNNVLKKFPRQVNARGRPVVFFKLLD